MKRNLMCLLMVVLCLACACGLAADKDHIFKKAEYRVNLGSEKEDFFTMSCYLMDGVDDMLWMEKAIGAHDGAPTPVVPFSQL